MNQPVISATGLWIPEHKVSNEELVTSFNKWATQWNNTYAAEIENGALVAKELSDAGFIESASGIKSRHVIDKQGLLDPDIMAPRLRDRPNDELSVQAEVSVIAAKAALENAGRDPADIDIVICSCSTIQRAYPAIAIEVQNALGAEGFAYDMTVGCASALYGLHMAADYIRMGQARTVLLVNPEICTGHINYRDRDSHFIFGDACSAMLVETHDRVTGPAWEVLGTRLKSQYSNNIRNNFGFLNRASPETAESVDKLMIQQGRKVFREVVPLVSKMIAEDMQTVGLQTQDLRRLWLHQANAKMNRLIAAKVLGVEPDEDNSPTVLDEYGNTSSAGAMIAFHNHSNDMQVGDAGLICTFGAGYAAGTAFLRKVA